jgi:hypothetical protein
MRHFGVRVSACRGNDARRGTSDSGCYPLRLSEHLHGRASTFAVAPEALRRSRRRFDIAHGRNPYHAMFACREKESE